MTTPYTPPSTIPGVKRLAKQLAREHDLPHHQALERAAGIAGFSNYAHAQRSLIAKTSAEAPRLESLFLTAYWRDWETETEGRETLEIHLPHSIDELLSPRQYRRARGVQDFKRAAPDHLVSRFLVYNQKAARKTIEAAHRVLQFIAGTGLRPADTAANRALSRWSWYRLPNRDHSSAWMDPATRAPVLVDEPYRSVDSPCHAVRAQWAAENGLHYQAMTWGGMYAPGYSTMYVLTAVNGPLDIRQLADTINELPPAGDGSIWRGVSADYRPIWRSPRHAVTRAPQSLDLSAPKRPARNSIRYSGILVAAGSRRPAARMPIEAHRQAGQLLRDAEDALGRIASSRRYLASIWSDLEECRNPPELTLQRTSCAPPAEQQAVDASPGAAMLLRGFRPPRRARGSSARNSARSSRR